MVKIKGISLVEEVGYPERKELDDICQRIRVYLYRKEKRKNYTTRVQDMNLNVNRHRKVRNRYGHIWRWVEIRSVRRGRKIAKGYWETGLQKTAAYRFVVKRVKNDEDR